MCTSSKSTTTLILTNPCVTFSCDTWNQHTFCGGWLIGRKSKHDVGFHPLLCNVYQSYKLPANHLGIVCSPHSHPFCSSSVFHHNTHILTLYTLLLWR
jgi:hypothetical protein